MTFKQLPYLLAIAAEGSLSAAARKLNISQPALSSFLKQLEGQIGLPLFAISRGQYQLTKYGLTVARSHQAILNLYSQLKIQIEELSSVGNDYPSSIRVGTTPHVNGECITEAWLKFRQEYPSVELSFQNMNSHLLRAALGQGKLDLVLGPLLDIESPSYLSYPIFYEHMVAVIPDRFPLPTSVLLPKEAEPSISLSFLADYPFILRESSSVLGTLQRRLLEDAGIRPRILTDWGNSTMFQAMIAKEVGVSIMPQRMVPNRPHLRCYYLEKDARYAVGLLGRNTTVSEKKANIFHPIALDWARYLAEEFGKQPYVHLYNNMSFPLASTEADSEKKSTGLMEAASGSPAFVHSPGPLNFNRPKVLDTSMLEYFCVTARCGSISQAADELYLSQPYLSRRLSALEKEMGTPLFDRVHSGIKLTVAGKLYLKTAEQILANQEATHQTLCGFRASL